MRISKLTLVRLKELAVYDPESGQFICIRKNTRHKLGAVMGSKNKLGRCEIRLDNEFFFVHRLAWFYVHGVWPDCIDHINGDPTDNRLVNLRNVTQAQNTQNRRRVRSDSRSGLIGAMPHQGAWRSDIRIAGKKLYLGTFATKEEAHQAYIQAKRKVHPFGTL